MERTGDEVGGFGSFEAEFANVTVGATFDHHRVLPDHRPPRRHGNRRQDTENHQYHHFRHFFRREIEELERERERDYGGLKKVVKKETQFN